MKRVRLRCQWCGERFTYERYGAGRPPRYCDGCKELARNEHARQRMAAMRQRRTPTRQVLS